MEIGKSAHKAPTRKKILFVCLGNICRSPLAEGVMLHLARQQGLEDRIFVDSAGTAGYHRGDLPDIRSRRTADRHGFSLEHRGRQVSTDDFKDYDLILAMDLQNLKDLEALAPGHLEREKIALLRDWDPLGSGDIPDPYYGKEEDFELVWAMADRCCRELLTDIFGNKN